jgi:formate hydrogenlyase subunit 4
MNALSFIHPALALIAAPFLLGIINRIKAKFAGRTGQPLLQAYYDLFKLLRKGAVYSHTTSWVFRAGPIVGLASALGALLIIPIGGIPAILNFPGDLILFVYAFGLMRFFVIIAALDTGSAFEGMGASREAQFSALAEPALFLCLAAVACKTKCFSLSTIMPNLTFGMWAQEGPALAMIAVALFAVLLAENARIPVDDPTTHLELTMIHEVMVLDHSGPDLAFVLYSSSLKLWITSALLIGIILPARTGSIWMDIAVALLGLIIVATLIGIMESIMARLRLLRVPQLLAGAGTIAIIALILILRTR